ncbi:AmmeMemoRadiSam system protein B [candidate division KSB1 bacterium]|nr:AmmeMemoRadiSam system protein B [candidate division KSB1 bacterium]
MKNSKIRKAAWDGTFYPADPEKLVKMIDGFWKKESSINIASRIIGLIAPHAGYEYSGQTAAAAYRQIEDKEYDKVIILAPSHTEIFNGVSIFNGEYYETPLGLIKVDQELAKALCAKNSLIKLSDAGHRTFGNRAEHSLEVHLPFLQKALKNDFELVPIVFHDYRWENCKALGNAISEVLNGKYTALIVASSDLYHGYSYEDCIRIDSETVKGIEAFEPENFCAGFHMSRYQACGAGPITAMQVAAREMGAKEVKIIARTNSADITGIKSGWTVGYVSAVITN